MVHLRHAPIHWITLLLCFGPRASRASQVVLEAGSVAGDDVLLSPDVLLPGPDGMFAGPEVLVPGSNAALDYAPDLVSSVEGTELPLVIPVPPLGPPTGSPAVARPTNTILSSPTSSRNSNIFATPLSSVTPSWRPPLSTRGRYIVDADGKRFKLKSGNWHGGSGTWTGSGDPSLDANHHAQENAHNMPMGLDRVSIDNIITSFLELGINSVRLQFSNEMIRDSKIILDDWVKANPQLKGMTSLEVYDEVVKALTARGIAVILNNHTNKSKWCCGVADSNERWNSSQDNAKWATDWIFMVKRYKNNPRVVGADLYNEVRRDVLLDPTWGSGDNEDWFSAAQWCANRILSEANSDILVIIEGINWTGIPVDGFPHGRPTLAPVKGLSHTLVHSHKLVYSAHFYGYTGPAHSGATGVGETSDRRYRDYSRDELFGVLHDQAMYVALDAENHYTAPVWISEFGVGRFETDEVTRTWFRNFIDWLIQTDADFAYWPLVGFQEGGWSWNAWGLMNWSAAGQRMGLFDGDDWRADPWNKLIGCVGSKVGPADVVPEWKMLTLDHTDASESLTIQLYLGDWDSGARKGVCPDGLRLIGMSHNSDRALCTDNELGTGMWTQDRNAEVVKDERYVLEGDWATKYTKFQCAKGWYAIGYSIRGDRMSGLLCVQATQNLGTAGRTVWFDQGDNRSDLQGGDFAYGSTKGACAADEYVAGVAFTTRLGSTGAPCALLCRRP